MKQSRGCCMDHTVCVYACMQTANIHKWEIWKFIEVLRLNETDRQMQVNGKQKHRFGLNALHSNEQNDDIICDVAICEWSHFLFLS